MAKKFIVITANVKLHRIVEVQDGENPDQIAKNKLATGNWIFWHHEPIDYKIVPLEENTNKLILKELDVENINKRNK